MMKKRTYNTKANRGKLAEEDPNNNNGALSNSGPNSRASGAPNSRGKRKRASGASAGSAGVNMAGTVVASNPFDDDQQPQMQHHHIHHHQLMSNGGVGMHPHGYPVPPHQHAQGVGSVQGPFHPFHQQQPPPPPPQHQIQHQPFQNMPPQPPYPTMHHHMPSASPGPHGPSPIQSMNPQMASPSPYGPSGQMHPGQPPPPLPLSSNATAYPTHPSPLSSQQPSRPGSQPQRIPGHHATPPLLMHPDSGPMGSSPHPPQTNMYGYHPASSYSPPMPQMGGAQPPMAPPVGAPSPLQPQAPPPPHQHAPTMHPAMSESPAYMPQQPQSQQSFCPECLQPCYPDGFRIICKGGCGAYYHQLCSGLTELAYEMLMREANIAEWACDRCIQGNGKIPVVRTVVNQTSDCRAPPMQWA